MPRFIPLVVLPNPGGSHVGSWRLKSAGLKNIFDVDVWKHVAQAAERARIDALFMADLVALWPAREELRHLTPHVGMPEALTLLSALAMVTTHIGLIATGHTEYGAPYNLARQIATLDYISKGRAGWNIVTSSGSEQAQNFGKETQDSTETRYARAEEFVEVVKGLWDSWEDDAYVRDKASGVFYDPSKLHVLSHTGDHYKVRGPLNIMRPPQGYPVLAQAGSSGPGIQLAARVGEVIYTPLSGDSARAYRDKVRGLAKSMGRDPNSVKILARIGTLVAHSNAEAEAMWRELQSVTQPDLARISIESMLGIDLGGLPLDAPLPPNVQTNIRVTGYHDAVMDYIREKNPTVRELILNYKGPGLITGTPDIIADHMEREVDSGAVDGFVITGPSMPEDLDRFFDRVIPELRRRGRVRTEYAGRTLRENLGLPRPANQFSSASQ